MSGWNDVEFELHLPFAPSIGDSLYMDSGDTDLQKDFGTEEFVVINRYYLLKENEEGIREGTLVIHIIPK